LSFENELTLLGEALTAGDGKAIEEGCKNLATLESAIIEESKQEIAALRTELEARDTSRALTGEMLILDGFRLQVEEALNKEDYPGALEALKEWKALIQVVDANSDYELTVRQMDVSEYPKVKVYISLENIYTGETVANLKPAQFYLAEEIGGTGIYQEKALSKLVQLDELEALNVCMVADVSGSMMGEPIYTLKDVMTRFANTVQYGIGDKVSLISFANSVYVESNFTSNGAQVTGAIQNMELGDMTAFYDALYTAINYTIAQQGAKCIIAFTDGMDNYSQCTPEMVTALANRYGIPIYIIGVGDSIDEGIMHYIADSTGGFYRSVYSIDSMAEIYSTIYRKQKEMYVAEYETDLAKEDTLSHALYMAYADRNVVARNEYYYIPAILKEGIEGGAKLFVDGFVIYDSDSRYLTIADLERLTSEELRLARNEIYARKGRKFVDQALQTYFNQCSWYMGSVEASDFKEDMLNDYEKANAYFIRDYERLRNGE
ncbi:MAG: YARHG domain-containing protein, partial [Cellulosilyticaceae bacterium]